MSRHAFVVWALLLPASVFAAPTWQVISSEAGKRIEIDRTTIKRDEGGKITAVGRLVLEKDIVDPSSGSAYRIIEATTRYDCVSRNAATLKRAFKKSDGEILREEEPKSSELPVRSGTVDDKVLREVCRPTKSDAREVAEKANEAAGQLKKANEEMLKKEVAKAEAAESVKKSPPPAVKTMPRPGPTPGHAKPAPAAGPGAPTPAPAPAPQPAAHVESAPKARVVAVRSRQASAQVASPHDLHWSYEGDGGPEHWAALDPKNVLCGTGQRQSPIDIREGIRVDLEPIKFDYKPSAFRIVDNGHTVQVAQYGGAISVSGKTYELVQFHFHKPAEEKVNGRSFDMVAHLVHRADDGKLAVVAILMEKGSEHPFVQTLWNNLPLERNLEMSVAQSIDLNGLLPENRNYFTYMGSLTTPPCSEGVLWLVLKQPIQVSADQVAIFSRLYRNNARPIQSASGRLIKESR
ncbi:MAG TPA: carbonic anhydrase family protein [Rhodocyclaceae bacterium]|nr:carbonic anhydrase family protein [Rhodocyclaceae bacterium]